MGAKRALGRYEIWYLRNMANTCIHIPTYVEINAFEFKAHQIDENREQQQ